MKFADCFYFWNVFQTEFELVNSTEFKLGGCTNVKGLNTFQLKLLSFFCDLQKNKVYQCFYSYKVQCHGVNQSKFKKKRLKIQRNKIRQNFFSSTC